MNEAKQTLVDELAQIERLMAMKAITQGQSKKLVKLIIADHSKPQWKPYGWADFLKTLSVPPTGNGGITMDGRTINMDGWIDPRDAAGGR